MLMKIFKRIILIFIVIIVITSTAIAFLLYHSSEKIINREELSTMTVYSPEPDEISATPVPAGVKRTGKEYFVTEPYEENPNPLGDGEILSWLKPSDVKIEGITDEFLNLIDNNESAFYDFVNSTIDEMHLINEVPEVVTLDYFDSATYAGRIYISLDIGYSEPQYVDVVYIPNIQKFSVLQ